MNQVSQFPSIESLGKSHGYFITKPTSYQAQVLGNVGQLVLKDPCNDQNRVLRLTMRAMPVPIE